MSPSKSNSTNSLVTRARNAVGKMIDCACSGFLLLTVLSSSAADSSLSVADDGGEIPVLDVVDVLVVGGSSGGVSAAVAAADAGAKVFLTSPRPYLGEDICSTYRYWLEEGEVPTDKLAQSVFWANFDGGAYAGTRIPFTYLTDLAAWRLSTASAALVLHDGKWGDSRTDALQFNDSVTITLDMGTARDAVKVNAMVYQSREDAGVSGMTVYSSQDGSDWQRLSQADNPALGSGVFMDRPVVLTSNVGKTTRFLKLVIEKAPDCDRLLISEVMVESAVPVSGQTPAAKDVPLPTPMQVKRAFDHALLQAGVRFLYNTLPIQVLRDEAGSTVGIVFANQSGRQAVMAKRIIDATERAEVARLSGATFTPFPSGNVSASRVVVGGPRRSGSPIQPATTPTARQVIDSSGRHHPVHEYQISVSLKDEGVQTLAEAEQTARDLTWTSEAIDASERLFILPLQWVHSEGRAPNDLSSIDDVPLSATKPKGVPGLFLVNGCIDTPQGFAKKISRPISLMALGKRVGGSVGAEAKAAAASQAQVHQREWKQPPLKGLVRYAADGSLRARGKPITVSSSPFPVIGSYDVVVAGGGTGGAPAAISAGRQGARTLVVEFLNALGGVGTAGMISLYYHGNPIGFSNEVDAGVERMGGLLPSKPESLEWIPSIKAEWLRQEARKNSVSIWFNCLVVGSYVEDARVKGILVATPYGCGVVLADVVVDSTGNAIVAAAAGAPCTYTGAEEIAVQGTGLPPALHQQRYLNTDYTYVDETDVWDVWRAFVVGREKYKAEYDLGQLVDTRERRRIIADIEVRPSDAILGVAWPDTITIAKSDFDSHGYSIHPLFVVSQPDRTQYKVAIPYRSLLPKGLDGVIVTGLGISVHRDTLPLVRMQRDIQNMGYAAGVAAAQASAAKVGTREIDVPALLRHLLEKGVVVREFLSEMGVSSIDVARVKEAVKAIGRNEDRAEFAHLIANPEVSIPLLREALQKSRSDKASLVYAHTLAVLGDASGAALLVAEVRRQPWDKGWNFKGMGQYGGTLSRVDSLLVALGRCHYGAGVEAIVEKAKQLTPEAEFSHYRAVALAFEGMKRPEAVPALVALLTMPGIRGNSITEIEQELKNIPREHAHDATRGRELRELSLARALYRCGDFEKLGQQILESYASDLRGHYARHARAVLSKGPGEP